jgi:hypothetical protein
MSVITPFKSLESLDMLECALGQGLYLALTADVRRLTRIELAVKTSFFLFKEK